MNYLIKIFLLTILTITVFAPVTGYSFEYNENHHVISNEIDSTQSPVVLHEYFGEVENLENEELNEPTLSPRLYVILFYKTKFEKIYASYQQVYLSVEIPPIKA